MTKRKLILVLILVFCLLGFRNLYAAGLSKTVEVAIVQVEKVQYKLNGVWTDVPAGGFTNICKDSSITFKAVLSPSDAPSSTDCPQWGGDASGDGKEKKVTFSSSGARSATVKCGNTITAPVAVDVANIPVTITWSAAGYASDNNPGASTCVERPFTITYTACADIDNNVWRLRVESVTGGANITVHMGGSRDPIANPPITQAEAIDAVTVMKGYYTRGSRGAWHTEAASISHEEYHYTEWQCSSDHYWSATETALENLTVTYDTYVNKAAAIAALRSGATGADAKVTAFSAIARQYWFTLGDAAGDRPYAAGQLTLNAAIIFVQNLAATKGWIVPGGTDNPSTADPCYQPWLPYAP